jgi:hypothetical protein
LRQTVPAFVDGHDFAVGLVLRILGIPACRTTRPGQDGTRVLDFFWREHWTY